MPRQYLSLLVALALVVASVAAATPTVAQSDSGVLDDFQDSEEDGFASLSSVAAGAAGFADRVSHWARSKSPLSDNPDPSEQATADRDDLQAVYNSNSNAIEDYVNARFSGTATDWDVIEITHRRDDAEATHYLVADVSDGNFTNSTMTNTTNRTVDKTVVLSDYASAEADAELERFVEKYVAESKDVDSAQMSRLASRYKGHVETPEGVA